MFEVIEISLVLANLSISTCLLYSGEIVGFSELQLHDEAKIAQ